MIVTGWKGGTADKTKAAGYGLKIKIEDRDAHFCNQWKVVFIHLEGVRDPVEVNIDKPSFWNDTCHELINRDMGQWLIDNNLAPWEDGHPPKLELLKVAENHFKVLKENKSKRDLHKTTIPGFCNSNGQKNLGKRQPLLKGTDYGQYVYVINCTKCGHVYGANGTDIHLRKCPKCQGGQPGIPLTVN